MRGIHNVSRNTPRTVARRAFVFAAFAVSSACAPDRGGDATPPGEDRITEVQGAGEPDLRTAASVGTLAATTSGGTDIDLTFRPDAPVPGEVELILDIRPSPEEPDAVSVDLVSPEMPAHGVLRYPATWNGEDGSFTVDVSIPMEGLWEIYVNLDVGTDAAAFEIRVPSLDAETLNAHDEHTGMEHMGHEHR